MSYLSMRVTDTQSRAVLNVRSITLWLGGVTSMVLSTALFAETSTLRVACDEDADGASISVNGKFKGECPIDIKANAGVLKVKAVKEIDGKTKSKTLDVRIGDGVTKRIEMSFGSSGSSSGSSSASAQPDPRAVAQLRYEAEVAEYNRSIDECRPRFDDALRNARLEAKEAFEEHKAACIEAKGEWDPICGVWDSHSQVLLDRRKKAEKKYEYMNSGDDPAGKWCAGQFTAPQRPL